MDTLMNQWTYDQFAPIELLVDFQEDRAMWEEKRQREEEDLKNKQR